MIYLIGLKLKLGKDQLKTLDLVEQFLSSKEIAFSIIGSAGTGKSLLIKYIIEFLEKNRKEYCLCAPTHKAKVVLERFTGKEGLTLHKLLSLSPNIELLELDFRELKFITNKKTPMFPTKGFIICDESSMVSDDLFELLLEKCKEYKCQIIFVGDKQQLAPVKGNSHSKVFDLENKFELTYIYRQSENNGFLDTLSSLRNKSINRFSESIGLDGSLYCYSDIKNFFREAIPHYKKAMNTSDILEVKMLAYTNARVNAFNAKVKELLFGKEQEYNKLEFLTGYENIKFNNYDFWNSMDYIIADEPKKQDVLIPGFIFLPGYKLNLYDSSEKKCSEIFMLSKEISKDYFESLAAHIEETRLDAIDLKQKKSRLSGKKWGEYYKIIESFTTPIDLMYNNRLIRKQSFGGGYAMSTHKSQGSSIQNVFIDMKNIQTCRNEEEVRQLQYVALSRTRNNAHILQ